MLGCLSGSLEGDFCRLVAPGLAQHLTPELERVGVGLERKRTIEREQRPIAVAEPIGRVTELVPGEAQVGIHFHRAIQLGQRLGVASQLGEGGATQRKGEARCTEGRAGPIRELQRLGGAARAAQQLEILRPTSFQIGFGGEKLVVRRLCVLCPSLARQPAGPRQRPLAACVWKQIVRRGRPHGAQIYPGVNRWLAATHVSTFLPQWIKSDCCAS